MFKGIRNLCSSNSEMGVQLEPEYTTAQRATNAMDRALDELRDEFRSFSEEMHKGFDSLNKHFDAIEQHLDSRLEEGKYILGKLERNQFFDSMFNAIFFILCIILTCALIHLQV